MGRRWTSEDRQEIRELYPTMPTSELAVRLDRSEHSVEHQASLMGISKGEEIVSQRRSLSRQKEYQCEPYLTFRKMYLDDQLSIEAIANKMGCSISKVQKYLEREGLTRSNLDSKRLLSKLTQHNSTFFDNIDTEEKAYWLGFFYADGYLAKNGCVLTINLSWKDASHLQRFANIFQREVLVHERTPDKRNGKIYRVATCSFSCVYLWNALIVKGIKQGNTLSEDISVFEHIPDELIHHFVRGFFDGDGFVHQNKRGGLEFGFVGSCPFMRHLRNLIVISTGLAAPKLDDTHKLATLHWNGRGVSRQFENWLYYNATIWLERKRNVFDA
jgi:hypothetical protein